MRIIIQWGQSMKPLYLSLSALVFSIMLGACQHDDTVSNSAGNSRADIAVTSGQVAHDFKVIAYYMGDGSDLNRYNFNQLTHIIYSFLHLDGNQLSFDADVDKLALQRLVALKKQYPHLKVMLSLGGWGGCETCSDIFNKAENRTAFAQSTLAIIEEYQADGIDLDWEYPTVPGHPGHAYANYDKDNFTALTQALRAAFGDRYELSFAAGGFDQFLQTAVDWDSIMPLFDNVNLMSYDIVNGASSHTGHHTALFSTPEQKDSTDNAVQFLLNKGVPANKIVIGAAFYARTWGQVENVNGGLYQTGKHIEGAKFKDYASLYTPENGYIYYWDDVAKAPSIYNSDKKIFATFDDKRSITAKTRYAKAHNLGGIMFWQLPHDSDTNGLVDAIYREKISR